MELPIDPPVPTRPSQQSNATMVWDIPEYQTPGTYRIQHHGTARTWALLGGVSYDPYTGTSREFEVVEGTGGAGERYVHPTGDYTPGPIPEDVFEAILGPMWKTMGIKGPSRKSIKTK